MSEYIETSEWLLEATGKCLLDDPEMQSLLSAAMIKLTTERLKKNLAILPEDFAHGLTTGARLRSLGQFVQSKTLEVVDHVLSKLPRETQSSIKTPRPSNEDSMTANDEIQDLVETLRENRVPSPVEVRTARSQFDGKMLQHSLTLTEMKVDLRRFVFPSMKSYIREKVIPSLPSTDVYPIYSVVLRVHWELQDFLKERYAYGKVKIDDIMTWTGKVACAQASPCGEYMQQTWPKMAQRHSLPLREPW